MYNVLVVDDDPDMIETLSAQMHSSRRGRFNVFEASTQAEFVEANVAQQFDFYFVDYLLPGWDLADGGEVVSRIHELHPGSTVLLISNLDACDLSDQAMQHVLDQHCRVASKSILDSQRADEIVLQDLGLEFRVLVVDDDPEYQEMMLEFLAIRTPHRVDAVLASSIPEGLEAMRSYDFDAYVFDYRIPPGTAMQLLETMPESELDKPVVLVTSHDPDDLNKDLVSLAARSKIQFLSKSKLSQKNLVSALFDKGPGKFDFFRRLLRR